MIIEVSQQQLAQIYQHAENTYPEECCGLLLGYLQDDCKMVVEVWETKNCWTKETEIDLAEDVPLGSKLNRFSIAPEMMLKAQKESRSRNLNIIGVYHSHPQGKAIPSEIDRAIAWEEYSYLIVALTTDQILDTKSWVLDDERVFQPEAIITIPSPSNEYTSVTPVA